MPLTHGYVSVWFVMIVAALVTALFFVAVPVILLILIWAVLTTLRICFPDKVQSLDDNPWQFGALLEETKREPALVGSHEIREGQRRTQREQAVSPYSYHDGLSEGLPARWLDDVWLRRN